MTREELVHELKRIANPNDPVCLSCERNNSACTTHGGCVIIKDAAFQIQLMDEEIIRLKERIQELERAAMTPQRAVDILRNANLGGSLRLAADLGIEALEKQIGGNYGKTD